MNAKKLIIFLFLLISPFDLLIFLLCEVILYYLNEERERLEQTIKQAREVEL